MATQREQLTIAATPGDTSKIISELYVGLGGQRGDGRQQIGTFGGGRKVIIEDSSRPRNQEHKRFEVTLLGSTLNTIIEAEDGGNGAEDPEQYLRFIDRHIGENWQYRVNGEAPEWVGGSLGVLAVAHTELVIPVNE